MPIVDEVDADEGVRKKEASGSPSCVSRKSPPPHHHHHLLSLPPFVLLGLERNNLCFVAVVLVVVGFVVVDFTLALAHRRITSEPSGSFETKRCGILRDLNDLPSSDQAEAAPSSSYQPAALKPFSKMRKKN